MSEEPVMVYECYVESVVPTRRTLNARSRQGKRFVGVSYLLPYMSSIGSGIDVIPEVGAECVVLTGAHKLEFVLGFKLGLSAKVVDTEELPDGSLALRAKGEDGSYGYLICAKGGTLFLGSGDSARTVYNPIDKSILHKFNNWEMKGPGGFVTWRRDKASDRVTYEAQYRTRMGKENDGFRTTIQMSDENPLSIVVDKPNTQDYPALVLTVDKDGNLVIGGNTIRFEAIGSIEIEAPSVIINQRPVLGQRDPI